MHGVGNNNKKNAKCKNKQIQQKTRINITQKKNPLKYKKYTYRIEIP